MMNRCPSLAGAFSIALVFASLPVQAAAVRPDAVVGGNQAAALLPIGQYITPTVDPGSSIQQLRTGLRPDGTADANGGISTTLSPNGKTLLVLTSGYNAHFFTRAGTAITVPFLSPLTGVPSSITTNTFQWVLVYDVSHGQPVQTQRIALPSSFDGIAWDPSGKRFYVSGGQDDRVYVYAQAAGGYEPSAPFAILNHDSHGTSPQPTYDAGAETAGVAVSPDGKELFAANLQNDSVSIVDTKTRKVTHEITMPGLKSDSGQYPIWVTPHAGPSGATDKFYVSCLRQGQVIVFGAAGTQKVINVDGQPGKSLLSKDGSRLYVVNSDLDSIDVIDTATDSVVREINVRRPGYRYRGANPNSLALSANGATLYTTLAGENAIGVIDIAAGVLVGRIPTAWYPSSVTISADGKNLYVSNMKSDTGPNPAHLGPGTKNQSPGGTATGVGFKNEYVLALEKGSLETLPIPDAPTLAYLSAIVDANDLFTANHEVSNTMRYLRTRIKHVIFIQKENRTYDQVLGDLPVGNGDPRLTLFPQPNTPNHHALAMQYVDLDNFYTSGDVSGDGWTWDYQGYNNDLNHQAVPISYAGDGNLYSNTFNGVRGDSDTFGTSDDRPRQTGGFIWDSALRAGLSIRHYGQYEGGNYPIVRHADLKHAIQGTPGYNPLVGRSDLYFRPWDTSTPDEYRYEEWKSEFDAYVKNRNLPNFEFMCIMMDHTGSLDSNVAHLNTPELDVASNDHAIGQIVDAVSHSPYWRSTAIFIEEDDAQDGPDHVDSHRSPAFVISPYTARNHVVHTFYNSDNVLRTMEDLLGIDHLGLNDANSASMDDVFVPQRNLQPYDGLIPGNLCRRPVDPTLVPDCSNPQMRARITRAVAPLRTAQWWSAQTKDLTFARPDANDAGDYNRLLWKGIAGDDLAYPETRSGLDLSVDRAAFLASAKPPLDLNR